jgi:hypothetical protein
LEILLPRGETLAVTAGMVDAVAGAALALGVANVFFGRRVFRLTLTLFALLAGAGASAWGVYVGLGSRPTALLTGAALGGLLAGVLAVLFYRLFLCLAGAVAGFGLGIALCAVTGMEPNLGLFVGCAVGGGLLTLAVERAMVIVLSSGLGALLAAAGGLFVSQQGPALEQLQATGGDSAKLAELAGTPVHVALGAAGLLLLVGLLVQFKWTGRPRSRSAETGEEE